MISRRLHSIILRSVLGRVFDKVIAELEIIQLDSLNVDVRVNCILYSNIFVIVRRLNIVGFNTWPL